MIALRDCCETDEASQAGIRPALARRARAIERELPGEPASDRDWRIVLGQEAGALPWTVTQRLFECLDRASQQSSSLLECR